MKKSYQFVTGCVLSIGLTLAVAGAASTARAESIGGVERYRYTTVKPRKTAYRPAAHDGTKTYSPEEIVSAGHEFFGRTTNGLAKVVGHSFGIAGAPTGYIVGEEASGAIIGGLRYGEGMLHMKDGTRRKVYWQGPSLGFDVGGNGARTMVLVYGMRSPEQLYDRYGGIEGSAYFVGGAGINFQRSPELLLAPIRTGVGFRLGANVGYLKYTKEPTWNPF